MNQIRLAAIALLLGAATTFAVYGQASEYGGPRGSPQHYDHDRDYDAAPRAEVGFFYDELSYYGDWVMTRDYGWAWFPRDVHPYWRPYTDGRWVDTEYGWTWISYEPFGWATYHYGRWARDPRFGWLWVPGTTWGPAWVSWQHGGGYVGWAPLPPAVGFQVGLGIQLGGFNLNIGIGPDAYNFVPERSFLQPRLSGYMVPVARNVTMIHNTTNITNYTYVGDHVVNRGVEVRRIEQATGRNVQRFRVAESNTKTRNEVLQGEVRIYRPQPQQLDTVRVGPPANTAASTGPSSASQDRDRSPAERQDTPELAVAPRVNGVPTVDAEQLRKQDLRAQQELAQYQAQEKRRLDKLHQQELSNARAQTERDQVARQHQAERDALQQEQRNAAQQLEVRQKLQREAALAKPQGHAPPQGEKKSADQPQDKKKDKEKDKEKNQQQK